MENLEKLKLSKLDIVQIQQISGGSKIPWKYAKKLVEWLGILDAAEDFAEGFGECIGE